MILKIYYFLEFFNYRIFDPGSYPKILKLNLFNFSYSNKCISQQLKTKGYIRIATREIAKKLKLFYSQNIKPFKVVKIANPRFYQQNVARPHGLAKGVHCLRVFVVQKIKDGRITSGFIPQTEDPSTTHYPAYCSRIHDPSP